MPRTIWPCSTRVAWMKLCQSSTAYGLVRAKVAAARSKATTAPQIMRSAARLSTPVWGRVLCQATTSAATTGAAKIGSALNLEEMASPAPTPARITPRQVRSCTIRTPPNTARTVKVVLAGSMAKKWLSWMAWAVNA